MFARLKAKPDYSVTQLPGTLHLKPEVFGKSRKII